MATAAGRKGASSKTPGTGELCREHFPNGWAGVEAIVPDAATVSCEHGPFYHPERYTPPADDELVEDQGVVEE